MGTRVSITSSNNQERIILCKTPQFVSLQIYTDIRWIWEGDRDWKGEGKRNMSSPTVPLRQRTQKPPAHGEKTRCHYSHRHSHGPPFLTEPEREGRAHPSPKRASRQAAGGTRQSTQLVTPILPFIFRQPLGRGKRGAGAPLEIFQGGKSPRWGRQRKTLGAVGRDALCL